MCYGLEDLGITDRYQAMKYGWDCAIDVMQERLSEELFEHPAPIPEGIQDFIHQFKRHVGGDGEFWLHELEDFAEALVAKLAKENKPVDVERAKSLYHPSFVPFKCPVCGSEYFGPLFAHGVYVGRYCKGRPSGFDRSYTPCRGKHEEMFEQGE